MELTVKYFGMLAEVTKCSEERLTISKGNVKEFTNKLLKTYPGLNEKKFKIAINQSLVNEYTFISNNDEIALLPPFAGG